MTTIPQPVYIDHRIAFGISYFATKAAALATAKRVKARGDRYNGGYFDGMPCGRDTTFDFVHPSLGKLYAVTTS